MQETVEKRRSNLLTPEQGFDVKLQDVLKLFGLYFLLQMVSMMLYPRTWPENNQTLFWPFMFVVFLWVYINSEYWPSLADFGLTKQGLLANLKVGAIWGLGAQAASVVLGLTLPHILGPAAEWAKIESPTPLYFWGWALFFVVAVIVAPLVEELITRGVIYGTLRHNYGMRPAIIGSTLFFALMHGVNPVTFIQMLIPGVALAVLYERQGSLAAPVITHAVFNLIAFVVYLVQASFWTVA